METRNKKKKGMIKLIAFILMVLLIAALNHYYGWSDIFSGDDWYGNLQQMVKTNFLQAALIYIVVMVIASVVLAVPGVTFAIIAGAIFGPWWGTLLCVLSATLGAIAGLICSPCTTAPLSAILLYIAQSGNMWLGGGTLYLYALGMGLPLMLITVFGNRLLPKSGPWMEQVKTAFGFVILALPVFLLERVIGDIWGLRLWSALGVAFFGWAFITSLQAKRGWMRVVQIILLAAALVSVRPLQDWAFGATHTAQTQTHLNFTQIKTVDELNQALVEAKGKPVMLDLYADWCVACKEFEKYTFSDPQVQKALADTVLLQANVTANDAQDVALLKHLNVLGLPTILFFDGQGQEHPQARVTGFMDAETFSAHLRDRQP